MNNCILDESDSMMVMAAHRYCLGRMTYIVWECIEWLKKHWEAIPTTTKSIILRDTLDQITVHNAGMKVDEDAWIDFLFWADTNTPEEVTYNVIFQLLYALNPETYERLARKSIF